MSDKLKTFKTVLLFVPLLGIIADILITYTQVRKLKRAYGNHKENVDTVFRFSLYFTPFAVLSFIFIFVVSAFVPLPARLFAEIAGLHLIFLTPYFLYNNYAKKLYKNSH